MRSITGELAGLDEVLQDLEVVAALLGLEGGQGLGHERGQGGRLDDPVHRSDPPAGRLAAAQDEPALGGQGAPDGGRRTGPGELEDEVVAAAVPGEVLPGVVDHVGGTERPDQLQVQELCDDTADVAPEQQTEMLRRMAGTYPHITELVTAITHDQASVVGPGCDDQFEFALDLMLDGLERLKDRA
jgi:hypothetical protein